MRRLRVLQLICGVSLGDHNGGAELFAVRLAQSLDPNRFESAVCAMWSYDSSAEQRWERTLREQGIPVFFSAAYRPSIYPAMFGGLIGSYPKLRAWRPDVVNTHVEFADTVGDALKLVGAAPLLVRTGHNVVEWTFSRLASPIMHTVHPVVCDAEVGVSRTIASALDQRLAARLLGTRARYIHNGVDTDVVLGQRTGKDVRAELGIAADAPLFGTVARLAEQKGLEYLIRAMPQVLETLPKARLLIAGGGELAGALAALVVELGLEAHVTLLGPRSDAADLIASFDVFVSPSLWEGLPTVVIEAMLLETPVVATAIAGTCDLVIPGETGVLVPPKDAAALARALVERFRAPQTSFTKQARAHVEQFSISRAAELYAGLYTELYATRRRTWLGGLYLHDIQH